MSIGAAVVSGQTFGTLLGAGVGLTLAGLCVFSVGLWLLPPRDKAEAD